MYDINITTANPKWVKAVKGSKDDTKDSKWIGDLFQLDFVPGSYIPCKPIRFLKQKSDSVIESIEGYQMTDSQKYRMHLVRAHLDYITSMINDIDTMLDSLVAIIVICLSL